MLSAKFTHACRVSTFDCTWWCPSFITSKSLDLIEDVIWTLWKQVYLFSCICFLVSLQFLASSFPAFAAYSSFSCYLFVAVFPQFLFLLLGDVLSNRLPISMMQAQHMFSKTSLNDIWMICMLYVWWLCCGDYKICLLKQLILFQGKLWRWNKTYYSNYYLMLDGQSPSPDFAVWNLGILWEAAIAWCLRGLCFSLWGPDMCGSVHQLKHLWNKLWRGDATNSTKVHPVVWE